MNAVYSFKFLKYRISNIGIIPLCLLVIWLIPDRMEFIRSDLAYFAVNTIIVLLIAKAYNSCTNKFLSGNAEVLLSETDMRIALDKKTYYIDMGSIKKMTLAQGKRIGYRYIEFIVKYENKRKLKIVTAHIDKHMEMKAHPLGLLFKEVEKLDSNLSFDKEICNDHLWILEGHEEHRTIYIENRVKKGRH